MRAFKNTISAPLWTTKRPFRSVALALLLVLAVVLLGACGNPLDTSAHAPDIILISLDTMRRDHIGVYGANPRETPQLNQLASQGVVFERAYAPIPFTLPSHLSMLTGVYPDVHGVDDKDETLNPRLPLLSEILNEHGFHSIGLVSNIWMKPEFGFNRGFAHYERIKYDLTYSQRINARLIELLDGLPAKSKSKPLFLFLHYIDAHSDFFNVSSNSWPYYAPEELRAKRGITVPGSAFCVEPQAKCATDFLLEYNRTRDGLSDEALEQIRELYKAGIDYLDRDIGQLFKELRRRNIWDNALIIVTADHGEEFLEHGEFLHRQPYVENLGVPLIVKFPKNTHAGTRTDAIVETVDLPPTILEFLGLPYPEVLQGRSLLPILERQERSKALAYGRDKMESIFSLRSGPWTLIYDAETEAARLYDTQQDPEELADIASDHPEALAELVEQARKIVRVNHRLAETYSAERSSDSVLSPEEQEKLRALGYLQ